MIYITNIYNQLQNRIPMLLQLVLLHIASCKDWWGYLGQIPRSITLFNFIGSEYTNAKLT